MAAEFPDVIDYDLHGGRARVECQYEGLMRVCQDRKASSNALWRRRRAATLYSPLPAALADGMPWLPGPTNAVAFDETLLALADAYPSARRTWSTTPGTHSTTTWVSTTPTTGNMFDALRPLTKVDSEPLRTPTSHRLETGHIEHPVGKYGSHFVGR